MYFLKEVLFQLVKGDYPIRFFVSQINARLKFAEQTIIHTSNITTLNVICQHDLAHCHFLLTIGPFSRVNCTLQSIALAIFRVESEIERLSVSTYLGWNFNESEHHDDTRTIADSFVFSRLPSFLNVVQQEFIVDSTNPIGELGMSIVNLNCSVTDPFY